MSYEMCLECLTGLTLTLTLDCTNDPHVRGGGTSPKGEPSCKRTGHSAPQTGGPYIGAKPNLYCEAIELVCAGSPICCVLVERKSQS